MLDPFARHPAVNPVKAVRRVFRERGGHPDREFHAGGVVLRSRVPREGIGEIVTDVFRPGVVQKIVLEQPVPDEPLEFRGLREASDLGSEERRQPFARELEIEPGGDPLSRPRGVPAREPVPHRAAWHNHRDRREEPGKRGAIPILREVFSVPLRHLEKDLLQHFKAVAVKRVEPGSPLVFVFHLAPLAAGTLFARSRTNSLPVYLTRGGRGTRQNETLLIT